MGFRWNGIYEWSSSENGLARFIYNDPGKYTAVFRVTDNDGAQSTDSVDVSVRTNVSGDEAGYIPAFTTPTIMASVGITGALVAFFRRRN